MGQTLTRKDIRTQRPYCHNKSAPCLVLSVEVMGARPHVGSSVCRRRRATRYAGLAKRRQLCRSCKGKDGCRQVSERCLQTLGLPAELNQSPSLSHTHVQCWVWWNPASWGSSCPTSSRWWTWGSCTARRHPATPLGAWRTWTSAACPTWAKSDTSRRRSHLTMHPLGLSELCWHNNFERSSSVEA